MNTLSAAKASRRFYGRSDFKKINAEDLPVKYVFNDRDSFVYMKEM